MGIRLLAKHTSQGVLSRVALAFSAVVLAVIFGVASSTAAPAHSARSVPTAHAAKVVSLNLTTNLHLIGRPGHVDYSKGTVRGTFSGTTSVRFVSIGTAGGEATFTIYPKSGGSLTGHSVTHGRVEGSTAYFTGTATITSGTGPWAHAHGAGLKYSGTLNRQNYHSTVTTSGKISA